MLLPVVELALGLAVCQPFALPLAIVGVTQWQRCQFQWLPLNSRRIEPREFVDQHIQRPAIGNDVVQRDQQLMLFLVQSQQRNAQQRAVLQIEWQTRLLFADRQRTRLAFVARQVADIQSVEMELTGRVDALQGDTIMLIEARAQRFMALDQALEAGTQRRGVQFATQVQTTGNVVGAALRVKLPKEPQAVLCQRLWQMLVARQADDSVLRLAVALRCGDLKRFDLRRKGGQRRRFKQQAQVKVNAQCFTQTGHYLGGDDGVAAQQEEMIVGADLLTLQMLAPDAGDLSLQVRSCAQGPVLMRCIVRGKHRVAVQAAIGQTRAAGRALQLAAGGFGQSARIEQHHNARRFLKRLGNGLANDLYQRLGGQHFLHAAAHFGSDPNAFATVLIDRKGRNTAFAYYIDLALDDFLDVLRVQVVATDDQHVFQTTGDVQLAMPLKAQIAGAQPGLAVMLDERLGGGFRVAPVTVGDARPAGPHFANTVFVQHLQGGGVGNQYAMPRLAGAATHDRLTVAQLCHIARQRLRIQTQRRNTLAALATRHVQRGFGQPVGGHEAVRREAATGELIGKRIQAVFADRLGAGIRHAPATQVEPLQRRITDPRAAQLVGKVGPAADGAAVFADSFQPAQWPREEVSGGHKDARNATENRLQQAADQAHVVVQRQPADDHVVRIDVDAKAMTNQQFVGNQVAMADLHALGQGGRARGVLQERDVVGLQLWPLPIVGRRTVQRIDAEQLRGIGSSQLIHLQQGGLQVGTGQYQPWLGIGDDRQQPFLMMTTIGFRRVSRHRNDPGVQAAEKRSDIVRPTVKQQNCPITRHGLTLQRSSDGPRAQVQVTVGQHQPLVFLVGEETQRQPIRRVQGATLKSLGQSVGEFKRIHDGVPARFGVPDKI
ncbi:PvdL [Pseudomonas savastanoi]|nr:PvdL [Pseudomonas savastanoi]